MTKQAGVNVVPKYSDGTAVIHPDAIPFEAQDSGRASSVWMMHSEESQTGFGRLQRKAHAE
jgi:hypothetical protein